MSDDEKRREAYRRDEVAAREFAAWLGEAGVATHLLPPAVPASLLEQAHFAGFYAGWRDGFGRVTALRLALRDLLDLHEGPCRFDHEGYCQAHGVGKPCVVAAARAVLEQDGG